MTHQLGNPISTSTYQLNISLRLIQQWRMVQALAESDFHFSVAPQHRENVEYLQRYFGVRLSFAEGPDTASHLLELDTREPWCSIAGLRRTLIYPHQVLHHCRSLWKRAHPIRFGFAGFAHSTRNVTLNNWYERNFKRPLEPRYLKSSEDLAVNGSTDVSVVYSKAGRRFPGKVWDEAYFDFLANSAMTLCPDGEEIWTYRFFEAMICGSVPVVQSDCAVYEGFRYGFMTDDIDKIDCSPATVAHNMRLCRRRLTIPLDELNAAVGARLGLGNAHAV